ncbi:ladderlectin-like [Genypterus blacodes]|uniref:ladderlectin-like n=1 Tax=Genypterus blacodes TaxID=154954 RepID=UPI003F76FAD0
MLTAVLLVSAAMALTTTNGFIFQRKNCPPGWLWSNKSCYFYYSGPRTWARAEEACMHLGGHLASVHSVTEYLRVQGLVAQFSHGFMPLWLGANDAAQEGQWFWSDGTQFHYSNWCPGQHNNHFEDCLQINFGERKCWDDVSCQHSLPFLCQKPSRASLCP